MQDCVIKLGKWHRTAVAEARGRKFAEDPRKLAEAPRKGKRPHPRYWPNVKCGNLEIWSITKSSLDLHICPQDLFRKQYCFTVNHLYTVFIFDFKTNRFYFHMLRGSSRCVRGSDIAKNNKEMVPRKLAEAILLEEAFAEAAAVIAEALRKPSRTWGLRQAVLKGINDTAQVCFYPPKKETGFRLLLPLFFEGKVVVSFKYSSKV